MIATPECAEVRHALGAYVLGGLDRAERDEVSVHLQQCAACREAHQELAGLPALLGRIPEEEVAGGPVGPAPATLRELLRRVVEERRRARRHRVLAAAAALVVLAVPAGTAYVVSRDSANRSAREGAVVAVPAGRTVSGWDPATNVAADVRIADKAWGTELGLRVKNVPAGKNCRLVAVSRGGYREVVATWWTPQDIGGTGLAVSGAVAIPSSQLAWFEVQTTDGKRLVGVKA